MLPPPRSLSLAVVQPTVKELKEELKSQGLSTQGVKGVLEKRLADAQRADPAAVVLVVHMGSAETPAGDEQVPAAVVHDDSLPEHDDSLLASSVEAAAHAHRLPSLIRPLQEVVLGAAGPLAPRVHIAAQTAPMPSGTQAKSRPKHTHCCKHHP